MAYTTDASRWRALSTRDPSANNHFVYTVKSTQVYCRPTCPARLARRANIGFAETPSEAQRAGYRACKRCRPDLETNEDPQFKAVAKARTLIEEAVANGEAGKDGLKLQDLATKVGLTRRYFHKIFKDRMGVTPRGYATLKMEEKTIREGGFEVEVEVEEEVSPATSVTPTGDGLVDMGPFSFDQFDFSDFVVGSDTVHDLSLNDSLTFPVPGLPELTESTPVSFGEGIDINTSITALAAMDSTFENIDIAYDRFDPSAMSTAAMFDLDAAFVLGPNALPSFNQGVCDPVFA
ncbi:unnamed protein product [Periconia digitata]|uniref:HTH araC/xylS-type domain-containing protein n=1 Tax=Periconia digitata TaxID=1303443 RepID=A0A9W4XHR4_9PLEO|nr:unnamed protein product [Periconia digitata]